jgi:hypothetical protein
LKFFWKNDLHSEIEILGCDSIEVHQDDGGITLRQAQYGKHIVELGGMGGCNPAHTPMEEWLKLSH